MTYPDFFLLDPKHFPVAASSPTPPLLSPRPLCSRRPRVAAANEGPLAAGIAQYFLHGEPATPLVWAAYPKARRLGGPRRLTGTSSPPCERWQAPRSGSGARDALGRSNTVAFLVRELIDQVSAVLPGERKGVGGRVGTGGMLAKRTRPPTPDDFEFGVTFYKTASARVPTLFPGPRWKKRVYRVAATT
eukprot:GHVT01104038.1.p1 GENE.GHVT01104038.1~~GHVT01104038.1.p1  ORF type:complete len:189 (-),score=27.08 GHVT01104038.1:451-1017(-)